MSHEWSLDERSVWDLSWVYCLSRIQHARTAWILIRAVLASLSRVLLHNNPRHMAADAIITCSGIVVHLEHVL
jgi:hypothetical protein